MLRSRAAASALPFAIASVLLGTLAFAVVLISIYPSRAAIAISTNDELRTFTRDFYQAETSDGITYAWTRPHAEILVPGLDRNVPWRWTGNVMLWRPAGAPLPQVGIAVDGVRALQRVIVSNGQLEVDIPRRPGGKGVTLTLDIVPGFVPNQQDTRELGVAMASMRFQPAGSRPFPPLSALGGGALAMLAMGGALVALQLPALWILAGMLIVATSQALLITHGIALRTPYVTHVAAVAFWLGLGALLAVRVTEKVRHARLGSEARIVAAVSIVACYLKLLVLLHPAMQIGDGLFHAHRLDYVLHGGFYFTSVAPGGYLFPYPILLYLVAAPFSLLAPGPFDKVALLRIVVAVADAAAGAMLYWMIAGATADRLSALAAVVWYHLIPMTGFVMAWGNMSNAFGQTLFVMSLATIPALPVESANTRAVMILALLTAGALLSHPSTCAILVTVLAATVVMYKLRGGAELQSAARGVSVAAIAGTIAAFVSYYAWFPAIYRSELSRVATESAHRIAGPTSSFAERLMSIPYLAGEYFGWAAVVAAGVGTWRLLRSSAPRRLTLLLAAWAGTCLIFLVVGVLTPVEMRYHFAAFPALAIAAAFGWSWAWRSRLPLRIGAIAILVAAAWIDLQQWTAMLR